MENNEEILKAVGEKLKELRVKKGYSSHESFAFDHDIPRMQYWRLEKGETNFTIKSLLRVLNIHNISLSKFFSSVNKQV